MPKIHKHPIGTYSVRWVEQLSHKSVRIHTTKGFKTRAEAVAYPAARGFIIEELEGDNGTAV